MTELAVVTGATGMVGSRIVSSLLKQGMKVRILTRNKSYIDARVDIVLGDLQDPLVIEKLLVGASSLFHCAAELKDEKKMWPVNVTGTQILFNLAEKFNLKYICHLSSVGVIGKFKGQFADESTACSPINTYEKSKLEAETLVKKFRGQAKVVILRPTNVVDRTKNNIKSLGSVSLFLKGGENAHLVHAEDVAAAALYFQKNPSPTSPDCFIVSCDQEKLNTISASYAICFRLRPKYHLPWQIPYFLRRISKGDCNRGDTRYSCDKLLSTGFIFPLGFMGAIKDICEYSEC